MDLRKVLAMSQADDTRDGEAVGQLGQRLREVRQAAGMSLRELARRLGVSPSFVSQFETGKSQPSVATLYSLSQVLDVSIDDLFEVRVDVPLEPDHGSESPASVAQPKGHKGDRVNRSDLPSPSSAWKARGAPRLSVTDPTNRPRLEMDSGVIWEQLASTSEHVDFMQIIYPAGSSSTNDGRMLRHRGHEYGYLIEGQLEVTVGFEVFTIGPGEALSFDSDIPHLLHNTGTVDARGIWCVVHPSE